MPKCASASSAVICFRKCSNLMPSSRSKLFWACRLNSMILSISPSSTVALLSSFISCSFVSSNSLRYCTSWGEYSRQLIRSGISARGEVRSRCLGGSGRCALCQKKPKSTARLNATDTINSNTKVLLLIVGYHHDTVFSKKKLAGFLFGNTLRNDAGIFKTLEAYKGSGGNAKHDGKRCDSKR